jgi:hypothetical protein
MHLVEGTLNATRHAARADEPKPTGRPVKPKSVKGRAGQLWDEMLPTAYWLTEADAQVFANWCRLSAMVERNFKDVPASMHAQLRSYGSSLGFDPTSRSRIKVKPEKPKESAWGKFGKK